MGCTPPPPLLLIFLFVASFVLLPMYLLFLSVALFDVECSMAASHQCVYRFHENVTIESVCDLLTIYFPFCNVEMIVAVSYS